jgi:hypothetical protein
VCAEQRLQLNAEDLRRDDETSLAQHLLLQMFRSAQLCVIMVVLFSSLCGRVERFSRKFGILVSWSEFIFAGIIYSESFLTLSGNAFFNMYGTKE